MRLFRRSVIVQKSHEDVCNIIRSSAYYGQCSFEGDTFSMQCVKRHTNGHLLAFPVKGTIRSTSDGVHVDLEMQMSVGVYIGAAFGVLGLLAMLIDLLRCLAGYQTVWYAGAMNIVFGLIIAGFFAGRSLEILDLLEHKLTR